MGMLKTLAKKTLRNFYVFKKVNWSRYHSLKSNDSKVVILLCKRGLQYFRSELPMWEYSYIQTLIKHKIPFSTTYSMNNVGDKLVLWAPGFHWENLGFINHSERVRNIARQIAHQNNVVYPHEEELLCFENKGDMYQKFAELGINHPQTEILHKAEDIENTKLTFPLLVKGAHSNGSLAVVKIENKQAFYEFTSTPKFKRENHIIIIQQLLNMRRDLRITLQGNNVILSYWRINKRKEWHTTNTGSGSDVDFGNFPEQWRSYFVENFKKLNCNMGAFDVAWENDDLNSEPLFLEFSPRFSPNPPIDLSTKNYGYGSFKKKLLIKNSYEKLQVDEVFKINTAYTEDKLMKHGFI